jgi:hypothetical protein
MVWWQWLGFAWLMLGIGVLIVAELSARRGNSTLFFSAHDWPVSIGAGLVVVLGAPLAVPYILYICGHRESEAMRLPCRLMLWLQIEQPPFVGTRCGTPLIGATPEQWRSAVSAWEAHEATHINWVKAHPRPKREWVECMDHLIKMRERR